MDISIIIVNWNSREYLSACLASIRATVRHVSYETIVIDAGSFDQCDVMLREHYPEVRFLQASTNVGFAKANNIAADVASGEYLLFLNPDTEPREGAIDTLHASLKMLPEAGLVGCRLLNTDGTLQLSSVQAFPTIANQVLDSELFRRLWPRSPLWGMAVLFEPASAGYEVEGISGACVMIRRSLFEAVGKFSEEYFMYAEDLDLAFKVRRTGYRNYHVPLATVVHHGGQSSQHAANAFAAVMIREAVERFLRKTRGRAYGALYRTGIFFSAILRLGVLGVIRLGRSADPSYRASWEKWMAVLRWAIYRDELVGRYYARDTVRGTGSVA
jgi:GT2 family glycosyltransferase